MEQATNLQQLLKEAASRYGDKTAVKMGGCRLSYQELHQTADSIAAALIEKGLVNGDRVVLLAENSPEYVACYFGIVSAGLIAVPLDPKYKFTELTALFNDCQPQAIFASSIILKWLGEELHQFPSLANVFSMDSANECQFTEYAEIISRTHQQGNEASVRGKDIANINYTSGPTLKPCGVMLSHHHLVHSAQLTADFLKSTAEDTFILFALPLHHIVGLGAILLTAISRGSTVAILPGISIGALVETINRERVSIFMGVPFIFRLMVREVCEKNFHPGLIPSLRFCIVGGAPTESSLINEFTRIYQKKLVQFYGLTEASALVSCQSLSEESKPGSVGKTLNGWQVEFARDQEIMITGLVSDGYYHLATGSTTQIINGILKTGDFGKMDKDGELYITGRKKGMIISKGQNIFPEDIEQIIMYHPNISKTEVSGKPDALRGEIVKATITLKAGLSVTEEEIRRLCRKHLANYKIPKRITFIETVLHDSQ